MGVAAPLAQGAIRISTGRDTTEADIDAVLSAWAKINSRHASRKVA